MIDLVYNLVYGVILRDQGDYLRVLEKESCLSKELLFLISHMAFSIYFGSDYEKARSLVFFFLFYVHARTTSFRL